MFYLYENIECFIIKFAVWPQLISMFQLTIYSGTL